MVVYQPSNHSMENLPQKQLQDRYTVQQLLQKLQLQRRQQEQRQQEQWRQMLLSWNNPPNLSEATVDDEIGIGGVGTWDCEMEKVQTPGGERENKRTPGVRIAIPLEDIPQTKGVCFKDAAMNLNVSRSTLLNPNTLPSDQTLAATIDTNNTVVKETLPLPFLPTVQQQILDEDFGIGVEAVGMGSERTGDSETEDEFNLVSRSRQLNPDTLPSNQASAATIDTNSAVVNEIVPPLLLPTAQQENLDEDFGNGVEAVGMGSERTQESETEDEFNTVSRSTNGQLNSRNLGKRKREKMTPGGERRNKKTNGVRIATPLEDFLQTKKMLRKYAAKLLKVSRSTQLNPDTVPSDQALAATIDINSAVVNEIVSPLFLPTTRQGNLDEDFGNGVEAVGMGSERTGKRKTEDGHLNSRYLGKGKRMKMTPRGESRNRKTTGVRIEIPLKDILQNKEMLLIDVAKHFKVSRSTLKRACREYGIERWPPRKEHELISQSHPNESVVDQERIPQSNSDTLLPSAQVLTSATNIVTIMARYGEVRIKFQLSWPWRMVELEQQVKKRLPLEAGTYYIKYKDEDDGLTLIACDEDIEDYISSSSRQGTQWIEVFLEPKVAHEFRVNQL